MRSCDEVLELISAALDGALSGEEQAALDEHLSRCPACSALFAQLRGLHTAAAELETVPAPDGFAEGVMARIAAEPAQDRPGNVTPLPRKKRAPWKGWAATAAVFAVVVLGAVTLPGRIGLDSNNSSAPPTMDNNSSSASQSTSNFPGRSSDAESDAAEEPVADIEPHQEDADMHFENSGQSSTYNDPAMISVGASAVCGVLTLTGGPLPEGLEEYEAVEDENGSLTYVVPAGFLSACLTQLEEQNAGGFTYEASGDETAGYGLIIVEDPS